jgi:hypothetical protein
MPRVSKLRRFVRGPGAVAATAGLLLAGQLVTAQNGTDEGPAKPRPVHVSPQRVLERTLGATAAFLSEDGVKARAELDALKIESPPLDRDRDEAYGHEILSFDQAFHVTINRAREYAAAGRLEDGFNQLVWVQRACVTCHGMARENGFLAEAPTSVARPADGS